MCRCVLELLLPTCFMVSLVSPEIASALRFFHLRQLTNYQVFYLPV